MAWGAMALGLLKLMAGLGRAVPRGCRPNPGGAPGPVRITGRELMTAATPRKFHADKTSNFVDLLLPSPSSTEVYSSPELVPAPMAAAAAEPSELKQEKLFVGQVHSLMPSIYAPVCLK